MFQKADSLFHKKLQQAGISRQVEAMQILEIATRVLQEEFGEGTHQHAQPESIKNRTLTIAIAHPAIAQQIRMKEEQVIHQMNKALGRPEITGIQFRTQKVSYSGQH